MALLGMTLIRWALELAVGRSCWVASSCADDGDRKIAGSRTVSSLASLGDDAPVVHVERGMMQGSALAAWTVPEGGVSATGVVENPVAVARLVL